MLMKVLADGRPLQPGYKAHRERGIGRYAKNLLEELRRLLPPGDLKILVRKGLEDPGLDPSLTRVAASRAPLWLPIGKWTISDHLLVHGPLSLARKQGAVVHFLSHLDAPAKVGPRTVITVHDLIAQRLKHLYCRKSKLRFNLMRTLETRCLYSAARLMADSEQTRRDIVELYGVDPERIRVVPLAADPDLAPVDDPAAIRRVRAAYGLEGDEPYFLYVGGIDQRKDLPTLLTALARLKKRGLAHTLALAGRIEGDEQFPLLMARAEELGLTSAVRLLGYVPDADLPALFSGATAFVFPSLYEGFGLPPLEAMACGAPVVAVGASSVPEVVGDAGLMVGPGDAAGLAESMEAVLTLPELAEKLRADGLKQAARFNWRRTAEMTLEVYREALHGT